MNRNLSDLWNNVKKSRGKRKTLEEIMAEKLSNLKKAVNPQNKNAQ